MTPRRYHHLASLAGDSLLEPRPQPYRLGVPYEDSEEKAVYVVTNHAGFACYVGQTRPRRALNGAAGIRLQQHLKEDSKRNEWAEFWVLPLNWSTKPTIVDWYEWTVAGRLLIPLRHQKR